MRFTYRAVFVCASWLAMAATATAQPQASPPAPGAKGPAAGKAPAAGAKGPAAGKAPGEGRAVPGPRAPAPAHPRAGDRPRQEREGPAERRMRVEQLRRQAQERAGQHRAGRAGPMRPRDEAAEKRRNEHRERISERWGKAAFTRAPLRAELRMHAWRMARLERLREVLQDADAPKKDEKLARVEQLIEREKTRHERRMQQLTERTAAKTAPAKEKGSPAATTPAAQKAPAKPAPGAARPVVKPASKPAVPPATPPAKAPSSATKGSQP